MIVPLMASVIDSKYIKMTELKDFTKLVPSQTPSRNSHRRCSVKKDILKNLQNFTSTYFEEYLRTTASAPPRNHVFL